VKDIIMPPIGLALSGIDFSSLMAVIKQRVPPGPYANPDAAIAAKAVTIIYGVFILTVISFLIIAARPMARAFAPKKAAEAPAPVVKDCLYCCTAILVKARRWTTAPLNWLSKSIFFSFSDYPPSGISIADGG
jgi:large conductance mechanosensitive channel